jgi:subtilase family serine protease
LPDLTVTPESFWSWTWSVQPANASQGETVTLDSWKVTNQGTGSAAAFQNGFYLSTDEVITTDDILLGNNSNGSLGPGEESIWQATALTIPEEIESGAYYIGILADRTNGINESDETNNYLSTQIAIGRPDLVISSGSPTLEPSTVAPGESVSISGVTVENQGEVPADAFNIGYYLSTDQQINSDDRLLRRNSNDSLSAGEKSEWPETTLNIPRSTEQGTYYIGVLADLGNSVAESDESNNYVYRRIRISGGGEDCAFDISPGGVQVGPDGYKGTILVYASGESCSWTASTSANWITLSDSSGTGDGSVDFSVSGNGTEMERTGTIIVAGNTFTVWQSY